MPIVPNDFFQEAEKILHEFQQEPEDYKKVLRYVILNCLWKKSEGKKIDPALLLSLIEQFLFDCEMERLNKGYSMDLELGNQGGES